MSRPTTRRRAVLLAAAGTAAAAIMGCSAIAQTGPVHGTITFENGAVIPKGRVLVSLDAPGAPEDALAEAASGGDARQMTFTLPAAPPPGAEIVVRLERADGWLLARGSAGYAPGTPVEITLYTVMY